MGQGIYIASKTKHAPKWQALRESGVPVVSTWIDEHQPGQTRSWQDLWTRNIREVCGAAVCLVYRESGEVLKGALVEMGAALAVGTPVLWVGPVDEYVSTTGHPKVCYVETLHEALRITQELSNGPARST